MLGSQAQAIPIPPVVDVRSQQGHAIDDFLAATKEVLISGHYRRRAPESKALVTGMDEVFDTHRLHSGSGWLCPECAPVK